MMFLWPAIICKLLLIVKLFFMTNLKSKISSLLNIFLGLKFFGLNKKFMYQRKYTLDILTYNGFAGSMCLSIPLDQHVKLDSTSGDLPNSSIYRRLVSRLLYLTITKLDISFDVQHLSQFLDKP